MARLLTQSLLVIALFSAVVLAASPEARMKVGLATRVLAIENVNDWLISTVALTLGYCVKFLGFGGFLEYTNPAPKTKKRMDDMKKQMRMGIIALFVVIISTTTWFWLIEPHTPYYGYYETHPYTVTECVKNIVIYMLVFDTYFYWSHRFLHIEWFMKNIHYLHHQFIETTAFAQDAVHPFEAFLQGPLGHFLATLIAPMHPVTISVVGFLTSCYALLAHDARALDLNNHTMHHYYHRCNFGLYWGLWDYICGTRYNTEKFPNKYIPSWERDAKEAKAK